MLTSGLPQATLILDPPFSPRRRTLHHAEQQPPESLGVDRGVAEAWLGDCDLVTESAHATALLGEYQQWGADLRGALGDAAAETALRSHYAEHCDRLCGPRTLFSELEMHA